MAGSKEAASNMKKTMIAKFGSEERWVEHMKRIGSIGGKKSGPGGFGTDRELARRVGSIGGRISKRTKKL